MSLPAARRVIDLKAMVAGQGGDGSLTVVTLLGLLLGRHGYHMYMSRDVASRIKGGHAAALVRGATVPRRNVGDTLDLLVAFDDEAVVRAGRRLDSGGIVIFDSSAGPPPAGYLPESATVFEIPFARMAVRDLRRDLFKNSFGFAVLARILSVADTEAAEVLERRFAGRPSAQQANLRALATGFDYADDTGIAAGQGPWALERMTGGNRILISGNEALAFGFLAAGGRFYTGYPITPASEILTFLQRQLPRFGGVTVQAEDELAAVNMALGAALTGARTMTASSGPGIALMQEGVSHAGSAEIPLVIVDCQRSGPSTGMPTKPEQSDLGMLLHGGNGDFPRIVLAPGDPTDCYRIGIAATNLAQRIQGPVYVALDQAVSQDSTTVDLFDLGEVTVDGGDRLSAGDLAEQAEYRRYLVTEDGVSPWAVAGTPGGMHLVTGNEHDEWGHVSTEPHNRMSMMDKRLSKVESVRDLLPRGRRWGSDSSTVGLIGTGMESGVMEEAVEMLNTAGVDVACLQPRTLWPIIDDTAEFVADRDRVYVVEHNASGHVAAIVAGAGTTTEVRSVLRYDGLPFRPAELVEQILEGEGQ